jgi:tetratricopeptide (TPR) repeat protein
LKALAAFEAALRLNPKDPQSQRLAAQALRSLGLEGAARERLDLVAESLDGGGREGAEGLILLGELLLDTGEWERARRVFARVQAPGRTASARWGEARALDAQHRPSEALGCLEGADLASLPAAERAAVHALQGRCRLAMGDPDAARRAFREGWAACGK